MVDGYTQVYTTTDATEAGTDIMAGLLAGISGNSLLFGTIIVLTLIIGAIAGFLVLTKRVGK